MGNFSLVREDGVIVFLATGSGIAPFKSILSGLFEKQVMVGDFQNREIHLYYGFRFAEDIFWDDYFKGEAKRHRNFHYQLTLSKPAPEWGGSRGYIQSCIDPETLHHPRAHFYICGGGAMVKGVVAYLREQQIADARIHFEPF